MEPEAGLHVLEIPTKGRKDFRRYKVRVRIAVQPEEPAGHEPEALRDQALRVFAELNGVTSTIVTVTDDPSRRMPVSFTVSSGPGVLGEDGDIRPKRGGDRKRVSISMSRQEARTMAGRVLGHYAFWEVRKRQYVKPKVKKFED